MAKRAIVRAEIEAWGLTDQTIDPGIVLLRLVAQSARRAERYALLLEADFEAKDVAALIGSAYSEAGKTGEYIRGLAALEAQERDRCANFAAKAVTAGVAERQVRLAEELGGQIIAVLRGTLVALGMDPDEPAVREAVGAQLRALPAG